MIVSCILFVPPCKKSGRLLSMQYKLTQVQLTTQNILVWKYLTLVDDADIEVCCVPLFPDQFIGQPEMESFKGNEEYNESRRGYVGRPERTYGWH